MLKLRQNLFWPLWPWPLTSCMDITFTNSNSWKFHDDTITGAKGTTDRQPDGHDRTRAASVVAAKIFEITFCYLYWLDYTLNPRCTSPMYWNTRTNIYRLQTKMINVSTFILVHINNLGYDLKCTHKKYKICMQWFRPGPWLWLSQWSTKQFIIWNQFERPFHREYIHAEIIVNSQWTHCCGSLLFPSRLHHRSITNRD